MTAPQAEHVASHYDSPGSQLAAVIHEGHLHLGYWGEENAGGNYAQASEQLTEVLLRKVRIAAGQRFCDFGCGVGVPALRLAQRTGCAVEGLTISDFQQRDATARARAAGLDGRVRFTRGDACEAPFADASFDGGWFFESIFHMGHRKALASARRLLKPGAQLLIADLTLRPHADAEFRDYARRILLSDFVAQAEYPELLEASGFALEAIDDVSPNVMPHLVPKIGEAIAEHRAVLLERLGPQFIEQAVACYQAMSDNLEYVLVTARRT